MRPASSAALTAWLAGVSLTSCFLDRASLEPSGACSTTAQCPPGLRCVNGLCVLPDAGTDGGALADSGRDGRDGGPAPDGSGDDGGRPPIPLLDYGTAACRRPTEATYFDPATGVLHRYPPDVPRILSDGSLFVEGRRTNLMGRSAALELWLTIRSSVTPNAMLAPDGTMTVEEWTVEASLEAGLFQTSVLFGPNPATNSVFVRTDSPPELFRLYYQSPAGINRHSDDRTATARWARYGVTDTDMSRNGIWQATIPAARTFGVWGMQSEVGAFPSQYIDTPENAPATRAPDECVLEPVPTDLLTAPWQVSLAPEASSEQLRTEATDWTIFEFASPGDGIELRATDGTVRLVITVAGSVHLTSGPLVFDAHDELLVTVDLPGGALTVAGADDGNGTTTGAPWEFPPGPLHIGRSSTGTNSYFGRIGPPLH